MGHFFCEIIARTSSRRVLDFSLFLITFFLTAECYYQIVFDGQSRLEISKKYISTFYTDDKKMENIDCVWDIQSLHGDLVK